jgi:hypothetical protein
LHKFRVGIGNPPLAVDIDARAKAHRVVTGKFAGKPLAVTFRYGTASCADNVAAALIASNHVTANFRQWGTSMIARGVVQSAVKHRADHQVPVAA